jgi:hypothetical protein
MQKTNCAGLPGSAGARPWLAGQRRKNLLPIMVLVGQQPDLAALLVMRSESAQRSSASPQPSAPSARNSRPLNPRPLRQDEQRPGGQGGSSVVVAPALRRLCRRTANWPTALPLVCRRRQQRSQPIEHFFRQLPTAEGVPDTVRPGD